MEAAKQMLSNIKDKLDELECELERLEKEGVDKSGDTNTEAERHRLALQDVLMEVQQRIDEFHELAGMDSVNGQTNWQQMDRDLLAMGSELYGAN